MKATGIVRRIDDLGRIVIPKEIRKSVGILDGDSVEMYIEKGGKIVLQKCSEIENYNLFINNYIKTLSESSGNIVCLADREKIISIAGCENEILGKRISSKLLGVMEKDSIHIARKSDSRYIEVVDGMENRYEHQLIKPIVFESKVIGAIIMFSKDRNKAMTEIERKIVETASIFLSKEMI